MKKFLLSFMALTLLAAGNAFATQVEVTMNSKSKLIKSLVNTATNESVEVGEPTSNKYTFDAPDGSYLLTATAADGETVSGTIQLDIDANNKSFAIFSPEVRVKNTDWVFGTDYTLDLKVTTKEGAVVNTTIGEFTSGNKMFMVFSGNTYYLDLIPSKARQDEGYLTATYSGTVTSNPTIQVEAMMSFLYSITVPSGAKLFLGTKTAHFVPFKEVAPESITDGGTVYTFRLADKQKYNYRVTKEGKLTQAGIFTMSSDETKRPELVFTDADMEAKDPKFIDHDVTSNSGYNVGDLFLNINPAGHLKLANVGDTYDILPMRNWELVNAITDNYFIEPDFHFTVVNLNGREDNSVVKVENELLTAVGTGTAIVLVTYDAIHLDYYNDSATSSNFVGGNDWGAIWPENTGVFVVTVGEDATGIKPNMIINKDYLTTVTPWGGGDPIDTKLSMENVDAEFDVLYYLDTEDGFDYTFTPEGASSVTLARPTIGTNAASYTGFSADGVTANSDGSYTLHLTMGRNIVCLTDAAGKSLYQVITAKPCHRDILVGGESVTTVKPGDEVTVQYAGLYHPAGKLAGIHNFNAFLSYKQAPESITVKNGKGNQYTMAATATAQAVTFTVPEDWTKPTIELSDGVLGLSGFGDPVGNHRATSKETGRAPNFTAISQTAVFGRVPAVVLKVDTGNDIEEEGVRVLTFEDEDYKGTTENFAGQLDWSSLIDSPQYGGPMLYPEDFDEDEGDILYYWYDEGNTEIYSELLNNYWDGCYWGGGIAISNYIESDLTKGNYENQLSVPESNGSKNFAVAFCNSNPTINEMNPQLEITIMDGKVHRIESMMISPTTYGLNIAKNGDGWVAHGLKDEDDYMTLTIHGMVGETEVSSIDVDLARAGKFMEGWTTVDLTSLGEVDRLMFTMNSNDAGDYGINQPSYFAFDNVKVYFDVETSALAVATFEDIQIGEEGHISISTEDDEERESFTSGDFEFATGCDSSYNSWWFFGYANSSETGYESLADQWNNIVGGGYDGSKNYGVAYASSWYGPCQVTLLTEPTVVPGFYITNSSYAYTSMMDGDSYAKKFDLGDWFLLTITGYDAADKVTGTKEYYLADLRDASKAYIINDWRYVDLSGLGKVAKIGFELSSSDTGADGMNTPAYFCFDDFGAEGEEVLPESNITTGIKDIANSKSSNSKWYDLQGRRVSESDIHNSELKKGMYIINGKKVIR